MLKRKFLSALLSAVMITSLLPMSFAQAEEVDETSTDGIIADYDFNGTESLKNMAIFNSSNGYSTRKDFSDRLDSENGYIKYTRMDVGYGNVGVSLEADEILTESRVYATDATNENIIFKMRFKADELWTAQRIFSVKAQRYAKTTTDCSYTGGSGVLEMFCLTVEDGKLGYNRQNAPEGVTEYALTADTWYALEARVDFKAQRVYVDISNDAGEKGSYNFGFINGGGFNFYNITQIGTMATEGSKEYFYIDYLKAYDEDKMPVPQILYNDAALDGVNGIKDGDEIKVVFDNAITEADMDKITIDKGAKIEKALSEDAKTVTLTVSDLKKRENYTLKVAQIGFNLEKSAEFISKDEDYYLFRAEFDGKDGDTYSVKNGSSIYGTTVENGILTVPQSPGGAKPQLVFNEKIPVSADDTDIIVEARLKLNAKANRIGEDGVFTDPGNASGFLEVGPSIYSKAGYLGTSEGKLSYGTGYQDLVTDYTIYNDKWYTFKIKINNSTKKMSVYAVDDDGNEVQGGETAFRYGNAYETIDYIGLGYAFYFGQSVDYIRIYDAKNLPSAKIYLNDEELDGQRRVDYTSNDNVIKVEFASDITENDLKKITIDGNTFESATLSEDGLTAEMMLEGCTEPREFHVIKVEDIGSNKSARASFRTKDEGKYIYRAEFDGKDDDSIFYTRNNASYTKFDNSNKRIADGVLTHSWANGNYQQLTFPLDMNWDGKTADVKNTLSLNAADKSDILLETKIKWGAEGNLESRVLLLNDYLGFLTLEDGCFKYGANSNAAGGTKFDREGEPIKVERDVWYTISISLDFKNQKYCINIVREGEADVYSSPWISMKNQNGQVHSTINEICYFWHYSNTFAPLYIDYLRITDEKYGLTTATYGDGIALDKSAMVPVDGNCFVLTSENAAINANGIKLTEVGGEEVEIGADVAGENIEIAVGALKHDTKYALYVPKTVFGAEQDQTITFRTIYDADATLQLPAEFAPENYSSDNKLNVAYFGGSITANNGWRNIVEAWFEENYGQEKVNHIRASIGGTGSDQGRIRLNRDVASKDPDIVFVEFAVNDSTNYNADYYMESIVRALNTMEKPPVIIFVYTTVRNFNQNNNAIELHDKIAESYGIPVINIRDYVMSKANTDSEFKTAWETTNDYISSDNTHPAQGASDIYGNYVTALLTSNAQKYFKHAKTNDEVAAVAKGTDYFYAVNTHDKDNLAAIDDTYTFTATGNEVLIEFKRTAGAGGIAEVTIDGNSKGTVNTYYATYLPNPIMTYGDLGEGEHTVEIKVTGKSEASSDYVVNVVTSFSPMVTVKAEFTKPVFDGAVTVGTELKATTTYTSASDTSVMIAIALYNDQNEFVRMATNSTTVTGDGSLSAYITPKAGETKAKAFVWNGISGMSPLTESEQLGF